jgi:hypothetical protein
MNPAEILFRETREPGLEGQIQIAFGRVTGKAAVWVHEYDRAREQFQVYKLMALADGTTRHTSKYYSRRKAALAYARKWLEGRAEPTFKPANTSGDKSEG